MKTISGLTVWFVAMVVITVASLIEELLRVRLGDYDRRIMWWLAGMPRSTLCVIVGLIARANEAGRKSG